MKNKAFILSIVILFILNMFLTFYVINMNIKYEDLKVELNTFKRKINNKGLDTITLKPNESTKVNLGNKTYTLKLLEIGRMPLCSEVEKTRTKENIMPSVCATDETFMLRLMVNDIEFYLDSGLNYSAQLISTDFYTNDVIYYVPDYNNNEATIFVGEDAYYEKERNLIIGPYLVYVDSDNKIIDINILSREEQTWGKKYKGKNLADIRKMIEKGEDLKNN